MKNHCFLDLFENNFDMKATLENQPYALRGFTLIELMVVIIVIGVVGGIIFSGAGYLFEKQSIKSAQTEIEVLKIALDEYKRENGAYPETLDYQGKDSSRILLHSLYGTHNLIDDDWERLDPSDYRRSLIPVDKFSFLPIAEDNSGIFNLDEDDYYLVDPWGEPYIYEFYRKDGNAGFLLYSKGPDRKSEPFKSGEDGSPNKRPEDSDNIPSTEPGKW
jgi:prepilin-type N-terminal cleavage/methylation domain-containing protein